MSLKFRLAFLYSLSVFIILLISALSIFLFNENFRRGEFNKRLIFECKESADLFFSAPGPPRNILEQLNQMVDNSPHRTTIHIFDSSYKLLYSRHGKSTALSPEVFDHARR